MPWLGDDFGMKDPQNTIFPGLSFLQWMNMKQNNQLSATQSGFFSSMAPSTGMHNNLGTDDPSTFKYFSLIFEQVLYRKFIEL